MTREDRAKLRNTLLYLADCLVFVKDMEGMTNCNTCGQKGKCGFAPEPGEPIRYNCPHWKEKNEK